MRGRAERRLYLPELTELGGGHGLESFTGDAHVVSDRDCQVCI